MIKKIYNIFRGRNQTDDVLSHLTQDNHPGVTGEQLDNLHACIDGKPAESISADYYEFIWNQSGELEQDPDIQNLINQYQHDIQKNQASKVLSSSWRWPELAKPIGITAMAATVLFFLTTGETTKPDALLYETAIGAQKDIELADNSVISLNTNTQVKVIYSDNARDIFMDRGEAIFSVEPDKQRPFNVHIDGTIVRAVGTEFNILVEKQGTQEITVSVLEGKVTIRENKGQEEKAIVPILAAGEAVSVSSQQQAARHKVLDRDRIAGWRTGQIVFKNVLLADAVKDHNRYSDTKIILVDENLKSQRISGTFQIGDTDALLFALQNLFDVEVEGSNSSIQLKTTRS